MSLRLLACSVLVLALWFHGLIPLYLASGRAVAVAQVQRRWSGGERDGWDWPELATNMDNFAPTTCS